jgi:hypothetical protein
MVVVEGGAVGAGEVEVFVGVLGFDSALRAIAGFVARRQAALVF